MQNLTNSKPIKIKDLINAFQKTGSSQIDIPGEKYAALKQDWDDFKRQNTILRSGDGLNLENLKPNIVMWVIEWFLRNVCGHDICTRREKIREFASIIQKKENYQDVKIEL
jgi:hypothetical protein